MSLPSGDLKTLSDKGLIAVFASQMPMRGTTKYTRTQLQDEFNKLKMSGSVSGTGAGFQTTGPNLPAAIRLAGHVARNPSFPQDEFDQLQKLLVTSLEAQVSEPSTLASMAMSRHFNIYPKGDPRYSPTIEEQLEQVKGATLAAAKQYYQQFSGAERAQISIVGDFNEAEVLAALKEAFGGWKSGAPWERIVSDYADIKPANLAVETPDKENALFLARLNLNLNITDADYPALFVANYIFGGGAGLDSRMMGRIRGKEGLSYGGGSSLGASFWGRAGSWSANATAAPQNVARIEAVFKEELAKALKDGFTAEEVQKAKAGFSQNVAQQRAQDSYLAGRLQGHIDNGFNFLTWDKAFEDRILAVTPEQVAAAFRKYVDPAKITYVKAGDFAKAAATQ
jgi:zinc protease